MKENLPKKFARVKGVKSSGKNVQRIILKQFDGQPSFSFDTPQYSARLANHLFDSSHIFEANCVGMLKLPNLTFIRLFIKMLIVHAAKTTPFNN